MENNAENHLPAYQRNETVAKKTSQYIKVSVTEVLYQRIGERAAELGLTMASYLRMLVTHDLTREGEAFGWVDEEGKTRARSGGGRREESETKVIIVNNDRSAKEKKSEEKGRANARVSRRPGGRDKNYLIGKKISPSEIWKYL